MGKTKLSILCIIIGFTFNLKSAIAVKLPGYIILNSSDTIFGEIKISGFDLYMGGIVFNGVNLEPLHSAVRFRDNKQMPFVSYTTDDISGFGFFNKLESYRFKKFAIKYNSIVKAERERSRFLHLIYQGELSVYCDIVRKENYMKTGFSNDQVIDYYDYYLFDDVHGLKRVVKSKDYSTVKDLLGCYELDQKFIEQIPPDVRFKNIIEVLQEYDRWKKNNLMRYRKLAAIL